MTSFGYLVSSTFASWVGTRQKEIATLRVGPELSALCDRKFQIPISDHTLDHWGTVSASLFHELTFAHSPRDLYFTIVKYFGVFFAESYARRYGLDDVPIDAAQVRDRIRVDIFLDTILLA